MADIMKPQSASQLVESVSAVEQRAAMKTQIEEAKAYPRDVSASLREAASLATLDEETAGSMFYALPRGGKVLEGPSVRLAEVVAYSWGNLRLQSYVGEVGEKELVAYAIAHDLEKNTAYQISVKRRIVDRYGKRYGDDMIVVTGNAACSIALRNAILRAIPRAYVDVLFRQARQVAAGQAGTLQQSRQKVVAAFAKVGVSEEQLLASLGLTGMESVGHDEVAKLRGFYTALRDGEADVSELFPPLPSAVEQSKAMKAKAKIREAAAKVDDEDDKLPDEKDPPKEEKPKGKTKKAKEEPEPEPERTTAEEPAEEESGGEEAPLAPPVEAKSAMEALPGTDTQKKSMRETIRFALKAPTKEELQSFRSAIEKQGKKALVHDELIAVVDAAIGYRQAQLEGANPAVADLVAVALEVADG